MTLDKFIKSRLEKIKELIEKGEILDLDDMLWIYEHHPDLYKKYKSRWFKNEG